MLIIIRTDLHHVLFIGYFYCVPGYSPLGDKRKSYTSKTNQSADCVQYFHKGEDIF
jgi:hypothetical protein